MFLAHESRCHCYRSCLGVGVVLLVAVAMAYLPLGRAQDAALQKPEVQSSLLREGTRIVDRQAVCRSLGERLVVSVDEDSPPMIALENLAAQRILKAVLDDTADAHWIVDGQITEFQERNYLLLERVVRQSKIKSADTRLDYPIGDRP